MIRSSGLRRRGAGLHAATLRLTAVLFLLLVAAACGNGGDGDKISWQVGTPENEIAAVNEPNRATGGDLNEQQPAPRPTAGSTDNVNAVRTTKLTPEELAEFKPNELGIIPVLEYHVFVEDPDLEAQFVRPIEDFRADLQWLYDHNFYVVPLRDIFLDQIKAPAGKHPVALTFDDSTAGQLRYLIADDGTLSVDPNSAVGVMEEFFTAHPDFGRGGFFAVLPTFCFDWTPEGAPEPDQTALCGHKLNWLVDHGYEIGNHTLNHTDLLDVDDETFKAEIAGAMEELRRLAPGADADILAVPFGNYPDPDKHPEQREWLRDGFEYQGKEYKLIGSLMVGAEAAASPVSTEWDPVFTFRIQAHDDDYGFTKWQEYFEQEPTALYTSDGNPDIVTIPNDLHAILQGTFDEAKAVAGADEVIRY